LEGVTLNLHELVNHTEVAKVALCEHAVTFGAFTRSEDREFALPITAERSVDVEHLSYFADAVI
jgi:hypothetical protein